MSKREWWEDEFDRKFMVEDLDEGETFISDWGFNGEEGTLMDGVKKFIRQIVSQARLKERERVVEEIEGTGLVLMEQELKLGKGGELVEMGENKVVEPDNYVKGYNRAVSDILAQLKTKKK